MKRNLFRYILKIYRMKYTIPKLEKSTLTINDFILACKLELFTCKNCQGTRSKLILKFHCVTLVCVQVSLLNMIFSSKESCQEDILES